jgi:hypothetical protein
LFQRLKQKWEIQSNLQLTVVLIVFAITGSTAAFVTRKIFAFYLNEHIENAALMVIVKFVIVTLIYPFILLFVGTLFGQFQFFKKTLLRWGSTLLRIFG